MQESSPREQLQKNVQSQPINATWSRRILTSLALKLLPHKRRSSVVFLPGNKICIKAGYFTRLTEAATIQFVAQNTSIRVPRIYCAFTRKDITYIVMERLDGEMLGQGWVYRSQESKAKILGQLKELVAELRRVPAPKDGKVADIDGGELFDDRLPHKNGRRGCLGPFQSVCEFHRHLRDGNEVHPDQSPAINQMIAAQNAGGWSIALTHGDLSSTNVLVRGDTVVGIVDWETAGWWPSYWEYTTASNVAPSDEFWREEIAKFLEPYPEELAMEQTRLQFFGDY